MISNETRSYWQYYSFSLEFYSLRQFTSYVAYLQYARFLENLLKSIHKPITI